MNKKNRRYTIIIAILIAHFVFSVTHPDCSDYEILGNKLSPLLKEVILEGDTDFLNGIIETGINIDAIFENGKTLLIFATENGQYQIVTKLLEYGANPDIKDKNGKIAINYAFYNNDFGIILEIIKAKGNITNFNDEDLLRIIKYAIDENDIDVIKDILKKGFNFNSQDEKGKNLLMYIASSSAYYYSENERLKLTEMLIKKGVSFDIKDNNDKTALMYAIEKRNFDIAELLITKGADVNSYDKNHKTILMYLSDSSTYYYNKNERLRLTEILIQKGVSLDTKDNSDKTALMHAIEKRNFDIAELLITNGANVNSYDKNHKTILMYLSEEGNIKLIERIIPRLTNINLKNKDDKTALMFASEKGHLNIIKLLLKHNSNFGIIDNSNRTALTYSAINGHFEIFELLLNAGAKFHMPIDEDKNFTLFHASRKGNDSVLKKLIEKKVDINTQDNNGLTALMYATREAHLIVLDELLKYKANINIRDKHGKTALMHVFKNYDAYNNEKSIKFENIIRLLVNAGADPFIENEYGRNSIMYATREFRLYDVKHFDELPGIIKYLVQSDPTIEEVNLDYPKMTIEYKGGKRKVFKYYERDLNVGLPCKSKSAGSSYKISEISKFIVDSEIKIKDRILDYINSYYVLQKNGEIEFTEVPEEGHIEIVVSGVKGEILNAHWEKIQVILTYHLKERQNIQLLKIRCIIDGWFSPGILKPQFYERDIESYYSSDMLKNYAVKTLMSLKKHLRSEKKL